MRVEIGCCQVIRELSAYLDWELPPGWRVTIEDHLQGCRNCAAVYDGVHNLLLLVADDREIIPLPRGFSERLYRRFKRKSIGLW